MYVDVGDNIIPNPRRLQQAKPELANRGGQHFNPENLTTSTTLLTYQYIHLYIHSFLLYPLLLLALTFINNVCIFFILHLSRCPMLDATNLIYIIWI